MTASDVHERLGQLLGAYALDALDPGERELVERHLVECDTCRRELDEHRATIALLVPSTEAPPELWSRIAASLPAANGSVRTSAPSPSARRRRWSRRALVPALAALSAAGLAAALTLVFTGAPDPGRPSSEAAVASLQEDVSVRGQALLYDPASYDGHLVLELDGVPAAPSGHHYEVWVLRDGDGAEMEAVGAFSTRNGSVRVDLPLPGPGEYVAIDVSLEADGGPPEHSGTSLAGGTFGPA
jgi:anti-sigma-K factor RskA